MAESLHISSGTGGLPKLLNNGRTLTFDLFTARSSLLLCAFVWEKCSEFQTISPLEPLGQCCSNFIWSLVGARNKRLIKWLPSIDQDGHHAHIRGMFEMNCLFLSGDFKFQVSPKVLISCPQSTPRG